MYFRVVGKTLVPADRWAESEFEKKRLKDGDIVGAAISKLRSNGLNRLMHYIGALCVENLDEFEFYDGHDVIKRLQLEGNIACDEIEAIIDGQWRVCRTPRSIAFDAMDESEFQEASSRICDYLAREYWQELSGPQIEAMAKLMVDHI